LLSSPSVFLPHKSRKHVYTRQTSSGAMLRNTICVPATDTCICYTTIALTSFADRSFSRAASAVRYNLS